MSNVRKTWKTLSAVPDPFEAGVIYVTQELTGHSVTVAQTKESSQDFREEWVPLGGQPDNYLFDQYGPEELSSRPESRVQRCRLHANGRLENTDVAPKDINDSVKVTVNPPPKQDIHTLAKLVTKELEWRAKTTSPDEWRKANGFSAKDALPNGLTISEDGSLLNWAGQNYVLQEALSEDSADGEVVAPEWLSDEVPVPLVQSLGILRQWLKVPGTDVAILGESDTRNLQRNFIALLDKNGGLVNSLGAQKVTGPTGQNKLIVNYGADESSVVYFFGADNPEAMRGLQTHHFMVTIDAVQARNRLRTGSDGMNALENLQCMNRLGDNPDGIVLARV